MARIYPHNYNRQTNNNTTETTKTANIFLCHLRDKIFGLNETYNECILFQLLLGPHFAEMQKKNVQNKKTKKS